MNITVVNINSLAFVFDPTDESCTYKNNDIWECTATWNGANGVDNGNYTFNTTHRLSNTCLVPLLTTYLDLSIF